MLNPNITMDMANAISPITSNMIIREALVASVDWSTYTATVQIHGTEEYVTIPFLTDISPFTGCVVLVMLYERSGFIFGVKAIDSIVVPRYQVLLQDGSAEIPSLTFAKDTNTGIFRSCADFVSITSGAGIGKVHIGRSQEAIHAGQNNAGGIYFGVDPSGSASPTGAIESSWGSTNTNPSISIGIPRDGNKTRFTAWYTGQLDFHVSNTRRGYVTSAGWNLDGNDLAGVNAINAASCTTSGAGNFNTAQVWGTGITCPGATVAGGTANIMGFRWSSPDIRGTVDNVVWATLGTASDRRLKKNIADYVGGLDAIMQLRPRTFQIKDFSVEKPAGGGEGPPRPLQFADKQNDEAIRIGFIADELEHVLPEFVDGEATAFQMQSVNYAGLVTPLIAAVQEQQTIIQALIERVAVLEAAVQ